MKSSMCKRFERPIYGEGQVILAEDLNLEQKYFLRKIELQNRVLAGACVIQGLEVKKDGDSYVVSPGLAYDCRGRELVVDEPTKVEISNIDGGEQYVLLQYHEFAAEHPASTSIPEESLPVRIIEGVRAYTGHTSLPATHERTSSGWRACNTCESIPIALIRNGNAERITLEDWG